MGDMASWTPGTSPGKCILEKGLDYLRATESEGAKEYSYSSGPGAKAPQQKSDMTTDQSDGKRPYHKQS